MACAFQWRIGPQSGALPGAMFFRLKPSGPRTYLQIVENRREDGAHRQHVIATLGRPDELAASGALASLLASGARLCDQVMLLSALERDADGPRLSPAASAAHCCSSGSGRRPA